MSTRTRALAASALTGTAGSSPTMASRAATSSASGMPAREWKPPTKRSGSSGAPE